jgi:hypothetical protein
LLFVNLSVSAASFTMLLLLAAMLPPVSSVAILNVLLVPLNEIPVLRLTVRAAAVVLPLLTLKVEAPLETVRLPELVMVVAPAVVWAAAAA